PDIVLTSDGRGREGGSRQRAVLLAGGEIGGGRLRGRGLVVDEAVLATIPAEAELAVLGGRVPVVVVRAAVVGGGVVQDARPVHDPAGGVGARVAAARAHRDRVVVDVDLDVRGVVGPALADDGDPVGVPGDGV